MRGGFRNAALATMRLWWMMFGGAYLHGHKTGLLDGEMSCLERELSRYEKPATETMAAIDVSRFQWSEQQGRYSLH